MPSETVAFLFFTFWVRLYVAKPTKKNIKALQNFLLDWYEKNGRDFPWRKRRISHYKIVIAETLLQRTKAETVSTFYSDFIEEFPNWEHLASADVNRLEKSLRPIGLYRQRAKRLKLLATEMVKRNGQLPREREDLESIPFIGQYIANAVELVAFNEPSPLIDVNMSRLLERYFGPRKMADIRYDPYLQELSMKVVSHENAREINWSILDFAAQICKAKNPRCAECPLRVDCIYYQKQL